MIKNFIKMLIKLKLNKYTKEELENALNWYNKSIEKNRKFTKKQIWINKISEKRIKKVLNKWENIKTQKNW